MGPDKVTFHGRPRVFSVDSQVPKPKDSMLNMSVSENVPWALKRGRVGYVYSKWWLMVVRING